MRFTSLIFCRPWAFALSMTLVGCAAPPPSGDLGTEKHVDLDRFMGDWYVIASIPTFVEKQAYNAVESYRLDEDGTIATTFTFRHGGFDGQQKTYKPRGFVEDTQSNAVWGMRFIWPFKADYRILHVDEDYTQTIIGRSKRDYVWIMARTPELQDDEYSELVGRVRDAGYAIDQLKRVPQRWNAKG